MRGKVAVGYAEEFLKRVKVGTFIDHEYRHDSQSDPMVKRLVDILDDVFHGLLAVVFKVHHGSVNNVAKSKTNAKEQQVVVGQCGRQKPEYNQGKP